MFFKELFESLEEKRIRYLVVGGVAMVLHGFVRATMDLDLMVALDRNNLEAFLKVMEKNGYKPKVPVSPLEFSSPTKRKKWKKEKGMLVFSFFHPKRSEELIDIFTDEPIPFEEVYKRRRNIPMSGMDIKVIAASDLMRLKKQAGRPQDLEDVRALQELKRRGIQ